MTLSYGTLQSQMELTPAYLSLDRGLDHDISMTLLLWYRQFKILSMVALRLCYDS